MNSLLYFYNAVAVPSPSVITRAENGLVEVTPGLQCLDKRTAAFPILFNTETIKGTRLVGEEQTILLYNLCIILTMQMSSKLLNQIVSKISSNPTINYDCQKAVFIFVNSNILVILYCSMNPSIGISNALMCQ